MQCLVKHKANQFGRDFVVGDLHGEYNKLMLQLSSLNFDEERDRLFCVGDLIDRGEDSLKCLNLIFEPWFFATMGNHEHMMLEAVIKDCSNSYNMWLQNGGGWYYDLYLDAKQNLTGAKEKISEVVETIHSAESHLPLAREVQTWSGKTVGILHGDAPAHWGITEIGIYKQSVLWGRKNTYKPVVVGGIDTVYVGHTPVTEETTPKNWGGNIEYIDSGAVFTGGDLCIVQLE